MDTHDLARALVAASPSVCLATLDAEGFPVTRAMLNLRHPGQFPGLAAFFAGRDVLECFFTTNTSSAKIAQLAADNRASAYYSVPAEWRGLCVRGRLELVTDDATKRALWQAGWEMYYPGGVADPDYAVLRLAGDSAKGYHQLSKYEI